MTSKLEQVLRHDRLSEGHIRDTLWHHLDDGTSLYCMRAVSSKFKASIDLAPSRLWGTLHMHAPLRPTDKIFQLERISPSCHTLIIRVQTPQRKAEPNTSPTLSASSQDLADYEVDRQIWTYVFKRFTNLANLTLNVNGDPAWPGRGEIEATLTNLRCALERAATTTLRSLTLSPIHICGIIHLRWQGFGALYEVASPKICADLWQNITALDIRLYNPFHTTKLTQAQTSMSLKILQEYLRSFSPTLRGLRFVWLDGDGPSPILLDEESGMENVRSLFWPVLEELHFGNIHTPHKTIQAISDRAPGIQVLKALQSTSRSSRTDLSDHEAWIDIPLEKSRRRQRHVADSRASSIYSQSDESP